MERLRPLVAAHGGALSDISLRPVVEAAAREACAQLDAGAIEAAVEACRILEDDGRFNAGRGALPRMDGRTVERDAACMASDGRFGAAIAVQGVPNPVLLARRIADLPHFALAGRGAEALAARLGLSGPDGPSEAALRTARESWRRARKEGVFGQWRPEDIEAAWNYPGPPAQCDTIGAVAWDGRTFAAAASTGGFTVALQGRVSDVPVPGGGIYAGPDGAVVATGLGEAIATRLVAHAVHAALADAASVQGAVDRVLQEWPEGVPMGLVAVGRGGAAGSANRDMPWAAAMA